jgi:hypothetical protein
LRGGVKFIDYLNEHHNYGTDISPSLIQAGKSFLDQLGLRAKIDDENFTHSDGFDFGKFA